MYESDGEQNEIERQNVSADWLDVTLVDARLGKAADEVTAFRLAGEVFAGWLPRKRRSVQPPWQFDELEAPIP